MTALPESLLTALRRGNLVPLVGAGLSMSVGRAVFPSWGQLLERLTERLRREALDAAAAAVAQSCAAQDYLQAAELALRWLLPARFNEEIAAAFVRDAPPGADLSAVAALWRLRPRVVVTTNYDTALEWPFAGAPGSQRPQRVHNDDHGLLAALATRSPAERPLIWHLHGSALRPGTVILADSQYRRLYGAGAGQQPDYRFAYERLRMLLAERPLLLVGFSLADPLLKRQIQSVLEITAGCNPVSFMLARKGEVPDPGRFLADYHVQVLEFEDFGPPLVALLDRLGREAFGEPGLPGDLPEEAAAALAGLRDELRGLVLAPGVVAAAYNRCKPRPWPVVPAAGDGVELLWETLGRLAAAGTLSDGRRPLPDFVAALADHCPPPFRERLRRWLAERGYAAAPVAGPAERESYVLVRLAGVEDRWRGQAWLYRRRAPERLFPEEWELDRAGLPGFLYALLDALESLEVAAESTVLGFMVPRALLCESIDQWRPAQEFQPEPPIGARYQVTVRPLERIAYPRSLRTLRARWSQWRTGLDAALALVEPAGGGPGALWLAEPCPDECLWLTLSQGAAGCAVLAHPPPAQPVDIKRDLLSHVLQAALPVALWLRPPAGDDPQRARDWIGDLLRDIPAGRLPQRVLERRAAAATGQESQPGRCLTLVWDDPDHLPPDLPAGNRTVLGGN